MSRPPWDSLALWREVEAAAGVGETIQWVALLEFGVHHAEPPFEFDEVAALVEALDEWGSTALYYPSRYAIQVHVDADEPDAAMRLAAAAHRAAVVSGVIRPSRLLRAELLTLAEFEEDAERALALEDAALTRGRSDLVCNEVHDATRALIGAVTSAQVDAIILDFVVSIGGRVVVGGPHAAIGEVVIDLGLDAVPPTYAVADANSVAGLVLETALPTLLEDVAIVRSRLTEGGEVRP